MKPIIYLSIVIKGVHNSEQRWDYALYLGDEFYEMDCSVKTCPESSNSIIDDIIQIAKNYKVVLVGMNSDIHITNQFKSLLWQTLDILPVTIDISNNNMTIEELACETFQHALSVMAPASRLPSITNINVNTHNKVQVDSNYRIHLTSVQDYTRFIPADDIIDLQHSITWAKEHQLKLAFINSTPRGGGVAMMRHALLRFFHVNDVKNVDWYVMKPDPKVFAITKKKFHNVLQGVSDIELTDDEKTIYEHWCRRNVEETHWATLLHEYDVIVIDDPQPVGIVPWIKKYAPKTKIVYRNHIDMDNTKVNGNDTVASRTFDYLLQFIEQCDVTVSHPIQVPTKLTECVKKCYQFPASTDPLDGLNKYMLIETVHWYLDHFDRLCNDTGQPVPDRNKSWIVQISRFDPSKGIDDVIDTYLKLPTAIRNQTHLIVTGHGSIDDPEGNVICKQVQEHVKELDHSIQQHITIIGLPPSDQLLNAILRYAKIALQLSIREGFEVKVTEAILKGVPVIAYRTGGIVLQIKDGVTGFLVEPRDTLTVADKITELLMNQVLYDKIHKGCTEEFEHLTSYLTPCNAIRWMRLCMDLYPERD